MGVSPRIDLGIREKQTRCIRLENFECLQLVSATVSRDEVDPLLDLECIIRTACIILERYFQGP